MVTFARRLAAHPPRQSPARGRLPRRLLPRSSRPADDAALLQDGIDLVHMTNAKRAALGLDRPAHRPGAHGDRARPGASDGRPTTCMSHTEPDGTKVFDRMNAAGLTWYAAPARSSPGTTTRPSTRRPRRSRAWMGVARPPRDHGLDRLQLRRLRRGGLGRRQALLRRRVRQGARPDRSRGPSSARSRCDRRRAATSAVTVRWSGADTRLQVLTSGLRYFQVQWRPVGGSWHAWTTSTATSKSVTLARGVRYEVRVRARDRAGNWGRWRTVSLRP